LVDLVSGKTDPKTRRQFLNFIQLNKYHVQKTNSKSHLCVFFLPLHLPSRQIYLGHHKKAADWIPPGGHIEGNEQPTETVSREMIEELHHPLTNEAHILFNLTILKISNPRLSCRTHYDFWYLIYMQDTIPFQFSKKEYYDAKWMSINHALKKTKCPIYHRTLDKVRQLLYNQ